MKDASTKRRLFGKLGVIASAAIILPLTATVAPAISAQDDAPKADAATKTVKHVKIIKINKDGKTVDIVGRDGDGKEVTKVERDGKIFIFRTDTKPSQDDVEKMVDDAQTSSEQANDAMVRAEEARGEAEAARSAAEMARGEAEVAKAEAAAMRGHAEAMRVHAIAMVAATPGQTVVRLVPGKVGFPMTEATYLAIRRTTASLTDEWELLKLTLGSLSAARKNYALKQGQIDKRDREILDALDREIGHLKKKMDRI